MTKKRFCYIIDSSGLTLEILNGGIFMSILITGGAGYIGSHTCIEMLDAGYDVAVIDNLDNSSSESLKRVESITGKK